MHAQTHAYIGDKHTSVTVLHICFQRLSNHTFESMELILLFSAFIVVCCLCTCVCVCAFERSCWGITNEYNLRMCQSAFWGFAAKLCAGTDDTHQKINYIRNLVQLIRFSYLFTSIKFGENEISTDHVLLVSKLNN